jgi:glucokinase
MAQAHAAQREDTSVACVIALDLGGTALKAGLVDAAGETLLARHRPSRREQGPEAVVAGLLEAVDELSAAATRTGVSPVAVGLAVPGIIDEAAGVVVFSANLGWRDAPLRGLLEERTGLPVAFGHDVRAGGLAEGELGAARGVGDFLFLALGTGVSGAVVLDGGPYSGGGYAGEIGHVVVDPGGRVCGCGARGCLETVASAAAIAASYGQGASAAEVAARAAAGEAAAGAVWRQAVDALADALAMYVSVLAPELIVVGGGLSQAGEQLLGPLNAALGERLSFHRRPALRRAALGDQAGRLGAALMAWERARTAVAA